MFIVCMSSTRVLVWVRGKVEQKRSLICCVFGHARSKFFPPLPSPSRSPNKASLRMARPFMHLTLLQVACCHIETEPKLFIIEHNWCHTSSFRFCMTYLWSANILSTCWSRSCGWSKVFQLKPVAYYLSPFLHSTLCQENLDGVPPLGANSWVTIFSRIQPNISFP